jgi:hypothetical protein
VARLAWGWPAATAGLEAVAVGVEIAGRLQPVIATSVVKTKQAASLRALRP